MQLCSYVPGKCFYTADIVSRSPLLTETNDSELAKLERSAELFISTVASHYFTSYTLPVESTQHCTVQYYRVKWPENQEIEDRLKPFDSYESELSLHNNLLLHGSRIVIPELLQHNVL